MLLSMTLGRKYVNIFLDFFILNITIVPASVTVSFTTLCIVPIIQSVV